EAGRAVLQSYTAERVVVETESDKPALLLLRDAFYPGWRATIDGVPTEIYPANLLLRGVAVPAGQHQIVFVYDPPVWRRGLALSVGGSGLWLLLVGWLWLGRRRAVV
ncbi:MAG TPA: YfhO family protein, partial [Caldilineaceae bacterium]|nr:YfhO family protein [Caldilineaceae bacterium]